jgi:hypothetical protein
MFSLLALATLTAAAASSSSKASGTCSPGFYWHDRGSYDCAATDPSCDGSKPAATCCCPCAAGFFCPGDSESRYAEEPCDPGSTSPPGSTSFSQCTGPEPVISQIHIAYTGVVGQLSVDFVSSQPGVASAFTSLDGASWTAIPATTFFFPQVGYLSQALLSWPGPALTPGQVVHYLVGVPSVSNSTVFSVTPVLAHPETFVIYGDYGAANDRCMASLIADAQAGVFDTVLHVGDWAYDFDTANSTVGNVFMQMVSAYAATHPMMPAEGNHEACTDCPAVPVVPYSANNFSHYTARMWSVASVGAAKTSGTGTPRYYSFNQGLGHFLVYTAEAYAYDSGADFIANQLAFMKADLAAVDRSVTPWVVGLAHKTFAMEPEAYADFNAVLEGGKVDLVFAGHVHYYNRGLSYSNATGSIDTACASADRSVYTDCAHPITIVTGAPGDREDTSKYEPGKDAWSATGSSNYGYGFLTLTDATHAHWSWKTVSAAGTGPANFTDSLTIVKTAA